jgi:hypothetical protein
MDTSIVQEAVAEFWRMPLWVQVALSLFVLTWLSMMFMPNFDHRRRRRQFDGFARELRAQPPTGKGWPVSFTVEAAGRTFEIRHDYRSRSGSYRGPAGYLLITETKLAGTRWEMHQVDILRIDSVWARHFGGGARQVTGASGSSVRFGVREDGVPVREGWMDDATREAVTRFLEAAPPFGVVWIKEGRLSYLVSGNWKGVTGPVLQATMEGLAELASALERTARGPMRA